ncbi:SET domain-containing protein [Flagellimonas pelagia]|uniref:SET domain-containing protein n=1 Tax=Flagellimonas pelagia TaxID=2306998 RepID=A0A3A1NI08_9FLAO|nr:SET domain-containing protein [Allomuricauda maritima]RIV43036.1 SET domain-containing protein [Allomuricauda maritima]TXJ92236.1 SET domain-containing protein [Allomuricauda maritima]
MIHPDTELRFISNEIGYGVVATKFIPAGTITWVLDELDREFTPLELQQMAPIYQNILDTYTFRNNKGNYILCWDNGRYVNHSFNSNCLTTAYDFEIAIRDIQPGEQLTDDYGYLNIPIPFRAVDEGTRRKVVYPDDLLKYYKVWDNKIKKVFGTITKQQQPLRPILNEGLWEKIGDITSGKEEMESILTNFYNGSHTEDLEYHTNN